MHRIIVKIEHTGKRIDKFLASSFAKASADKEDFLFSRGEIAKKIRNGKVKINNRIVKPSHILKEGDEISIENFSKVKKNKLIPNKKISLDIIFEDKNVIVLNKQAGVQVHPSHNEKENTIVNALINYFPKIKNVHDDSPEGKMRPGIVHRLDKDTSGVMVVAKNQKAFDEMKKLFKDRRIEKKYVAVCEGIFKDKNGVIEKPIARASSYRKQVIAGKKTKTKIRPAVTSYKVLEEKNGYSMVEAMPKTGRMHQIRLHLASIGHPIMGDLIYNIKKIDRKAKRQLLHAKELKFELFGKKYDFLVPMPGDFKKFVAKVD